MATTLSYSVGFVVLMVASILVVAQNNDADPCSSLAISNTVDGCKLCVKTLAKNATANTTSLTCIFAHITAAEGLTCSTDPASEETSERALNSTDCEKLKFPIDPPHTTIPPSTTSTTAPSTSTNATTAVPTNATTTGVPSTTTTTIPTTTPNSTSTTPIPTTQTPSNTSTTTPGPKPTPAPASSGMSVASFFGGIVFTLAVSAVGYLVWRFYKVRMDRNYHTFSNPTF